MDTDRQFIIASRTSSACTMKKTTIETISKPRSFNMWVTISLFLLLTLLSDVAKGQQLDYRIREEQEIGTYVGNVARDSLIFNQYNQSEFQNLQYRIPSTKLSIDSKTSTIRTAQVLDREAECEGLFSNEPCTMDFDVSVYRVNSDGSFNLLRIITVKVAIDDINDNAPEFPSNETTLDVPESFGVNKVLRTSGAIDKDTGVNNTVQKYTLEGGMDVFELQVTSNAGGNSDLGLILKKELDREKKSSYKLKVIAEDGGFPKLSGSVNILVRVIDVNDNQPLFTKTSFDTAVSEDRPVGSTILTLLAEDPDEGENGRMTFSFSSLTPSKVTDCLAINETSGDVRLIKSLNYEKDKSYRFTVIVSDNGSPAMSSQTQVQVTVEDVNDNAPQIEITLPSANIKESIGIGNYIAHVSLSDLDSSQNSEISCNIENEHFVLKKFEGSDSIYTVILHRHLDYEKSHIQVVNVTCHDGGEPPMTNSSAFTIHVQDVNDNAPVFTRSTYRTSIDEGNYVGQFVAQVQAVDPDQGDNGEVSYSLQDKSDPLFQINPVSGVIKAMQQLDREETSSYELVVIAKDKGSTPISSSVTVTVIVADINDNPPKFIRPLFEMRVQENKPKHTVVDSVFARDPDTDSDNHLRFQFTENFTFPDIFDIDRKTGIVFTLVPLDREVRDSYIFNVMVWDESRPTFRDFARVSVFVKDDNDNAPNITFPNEFNNTFHIMYTHPVGSAVLTLDCEDKDAGENASVKYSIVHGNSKALFFVNSITGDLMVSKRMNIYDAGTYNLVILARDGGLSYLESRRDINIVVTVANGTASYMGEDAADANIAIVIALVCITGVLAMAVVITICIIRRIDRERKQHNGAKVEEENIYKQQAPHETPMSTPTRDNGENEIEKLKRKIKRDLSFGLEDDGGSPLDASDATNKSSSFSTFKNSTSGSTEQKSLSTPQAHSSVLQNTLSPSEGNVKRVHYMDKGMDIDRLTTTSPPPRSQPTSSAYHSGRGTHWSHNRAQSPRSSVIKLPVEDATSHSSGSTSDSGRGGSSEEGEGHGHAHAVVVALGDGDRGQGSSNTYPTSAQLMTFGSPKSSGSSSGTSHAPRSLSTSLNSETAKKRLWSDTTPSTTTSGLSLSSRMSSEATLQPEGMSETSGYFKPNISFSDDSVTANTLVSKNANSASASNMGVNRTNWNENHRGKSSSSSNLLSASAKSSDAPATAPKPASQFSSTQRQRIPSYSNNTDTPYRLLAANISRIPPNDSTSMRHGAFIDGTGSSVLEPSATSRSRSYANASRPLGNDSNTIGNGNNMNARSSVRNTSLPRDQVSNSSHTFNSRGNDTPSTALGEPYSFRDMKDVLDEASTVGTHQDDDNTTTTSGSYTINADDLCQEIDQLFFNDIVV